MKRSSLGILPLAFALFSGCISDSNSQDQSKMVLDGVIDTSKKNSNSSNFDFEAEFDSVVVVKSTCSEIGELKSTYIELEYDDSDFSGKKYRRKIEVQTDPNTGDVKSISVSEDQYSERHHNFVSEAHYKMEIDTCTVQVPSVLFPSR